MKLRLYPALIFLNLLILLCITSCTQRPESTGKGSQPDETKDTAMERTSSNAVEQSQPLTNVESIQTAYTDIVSKTNSGSLDSTSFKYSCHGEKSGTVSFYTEKGQLRLVVHRYNEYDHYSSEDRYFVKDSTLFFSLTKSATWAFESGPEGATKSNIKERRVYLVNGKPIKCLEKKFVIRSQAKDNPSSETAPNLDVECPAPEAAMKQYLLLTGFRNNPTSGCLDEVKR